MTARRNRAVRHAPAAGKADGQCEDNPVGCEISELLRVLGKAYMLEILHIFTHEGPGPKRFVELQSRLGMSPNTLSDRLKELVQAGLLSRTPYSEIPPRVDYEATPKALDLGPVFRSLQEWAGRHNLKPEQEAKPPAIEVTA